VFEYNGAPMSVECLHHVQLAMPAGGEPRARELHQGLAGIAEVPKPAALAVRGGCWFRLELLEQQPRPA
jgi:hypothetical protein